MRASHANDEAQPQTEDPLGVVDFPVSCSEQAQAPFNRAVALLHHMTYTQARVAFEAIATSDPHCAMAHWGIAMTLFQPLWPTRPRPEALQRGWDEVQKAKTLQPSTERERLFVAAAEAFFLEPASSDYWLRIRRWEPAEQSVYAAFPDDADAAAFYALALLATAPSNSASRAHADQAAQILLRVYQQHPNHPGAMHYLVHANDVPGRERESLDITRKYEMSAPRNAHALHMPTHIYTRLGDWDGVIRGNLRAAAAALQQPAGQHGEWVSDEFAHAIEYLVYAYLQKGMDDAAATQVQRLREMARVEPTFKTAFHRASTQARYALERRDWNAAILLVPAEPSMPDSPHFPWPDAITWFAHGLGAAHLEKLDEARAANARIAELEEAARKSGEDLFARNIQLLHLELSAWIAHAERQQESSLALMRQAIELETSTPKHAVTPGPTLPADELLGDLLMEQQKASEALAAYQRSLELYPRRFNSLLGAARAAQAAAETARAHTYYQQLLEVADGGARQPALTEARNYLSRGQ
ncbi:MAG: hypothetical protein ABI843_06110 [Dokdonella sp.]